MNNPEAQKETEQIANIYSNQSYRKHSQRGQKALIQKRNDEQAIQIMGETLEDSDKETEVKDNKIFLADQTGISDKQLLKEVRQVKLDEILNRRKTMKES